MKMCIDIFGTPFPKSASLELKTDLGTVWGLGGHCGRGCSFARELLKG